MTRLRGAICRGADRRGWCRDREEARGDAPRGRRTCAVGEKGATAGMVAEGVALALVTPTMRGLT
ncbi:hypothetical protein HMPREF9058_0780 [Actinomyces sp. oral taxon 175 str. F0384]|nr:hypothetical protein HMPREF9058_0780 [Actinomyces sp. oral taxon 175 str. F0384]